MRDAGKTWLRPHRTVLPVSRDAHENRGSVDLLELVITEPPFFQRAGPEILDNDVAFCGELLQQFPPALARQIQGHAFLVAGFGEPHQRIAAFGIGAEPPQRVAGLRRFDLDDLGAEFAQNGGAMRPRNEGAEIEDSDSTQRAHALSPMLAARSSNFLATLMCIRSI